MSTPQLLRLMEDVALRRQLLEHLRRSGRPNLTHLSGRGEHATELFAAWMAHVRDLRRGYLSCAIYDRFKDQYNSLVADFPEVNDVLEDILHVGRTDLTESKLWRLFVWMWFGCGGAYMQAWRMCKNWPAVKTYRRNDVSQPLVLLKTIRLAAKAHDSLTAIIGGDGLDKKSRVAKERDLVDWHSGVPSLITAWKSSSDKFRAELKKLPAFRTGRLTCKEFYCCLAASSVPTLRRFGEESMTWGPGAVDGSKRFLGGVKPIAGDEVMKTIGELVAKHSLSGCKKVLVGDVEVSLCTIEHYMKHVGQLNLGYDAQALTVFPGYRPYLGDAYENEPHYPNVPTEQRSVSSLPSRWYTRALAKKLKKNVKKTPGTKEPKKDVKKKPGTKKLKKDVKKKVLKKPGARSAPAFMGLDGLRAPRGTAEGRVSTAKGRKKWSPKHPHFCTVCKLWFGARAKMHCNTPLQLNAGDIVRRR